MNQAQAEGKRAPEGHWGFQRQGRWTGGHTRRRFTVVNYVYGLNT
jgi:hypothetical protein